ncbi:MAG: hypothetical protein JWR00_1842, partial [Rubritepida sp.]|nr:hypothetical protein [Rubritepida sp.]
MRVSPTRPGSGRRTFALALAACGLLAGCGTSGIQVEREAHLPPGSAGASFMVLAARGQDSDPGYARNAELVAAELTARHFVRVMEPAAARFAVMVWERSRDTPARATRLGDSPTSGSRGRGRGGSFGGGMGMSGGGRTRGDSSPVETSGPGPRPVRRVEIQIYDITQP